MAAGSFESHPSDSLFVKIADTSFKNVAGFIYFRVTLTDQNCMQEEIKSRLNCGNNCYHSVQNLVFLFDI